jgi:hypothetical protein
MTASMPPRLPEIIHVGPGRTGTTWLHRVLEGHVNLPYGVKETQFFTNYYDKGIDWYARHFRYATGDRKIVEICPYFFKPEARERIKLHMPSCWIVVTLRDPVDRMYSMYKLLRHYGAARRGSFEETLKVWPTMGGGNEYAPHLQQWFDKFGRENVLVTMYDELRSDPQKFLNRMTAFMGVEAIALSERRGIGDDVHSFARAPKNPRLARNAFNLMYWLKGRQAYGTVSMLERAGVWQFCWGRGEGFPRLTPEQDARLRARYLPEVDTLEELLGIDLSAWKTPRSADTSAARPAPRLALG